MEGENPTRRGDITTRRNSPCHPDILFFRRLPLYDRSALLRTSIAFLLVVCGNGVAQSLAAYPPEGYPPEGHAAERMIQENEAPASLSAVGIVWTPGGSDVEEVRALRMMEGHGIRHVRATRPPTPEGLQAAATFGIALYVDVSAPVSREEVYWEHPAVAGIGWSGPLSYSGCIRWGQIRAGLPSSVTPYVVAPVTPDGSRCTFDEATLVLVDGRMMIRPFARWQAWTQAHAGPVGLAAIGIPRSDAAEPGWTVPRSAEAQARYLEERLGQAHARSVPITFVAGWDASANRGPARFQLTIGEALTPAGQVAVSAVEERPSPFAFAPGEDRAFQDRIWSGLVLMVWVVLFATAGSVIYVPSVRRLVLRYLSAHVFYCESVREGRDATGIAAALIGGCIAGALWVGSVAVLNELAWVRPAVIAAETLSSTGRDLVETAWAAPLAVAAVGVTLWSAALAGWAALVAAGSRWGTTKLSWRQAFMLGALPWWGVLPWMLLTMAGGTLYPADAPLLLLGGALIGSAWTVLRTTYDVYQTTQDWLAGAALLLTPGSLVLGLCAGFLYVHGAELGWLVQVLRYA